jgi:hypothetical protein
LIWEIYELTLFNLNFMNVQAYAYYSLSSQGNCQSIVLSNQINAWLKYTMFICNPVCFYSPHHKLVLFRVRFCLSLSGSCLQLIYYFIISIHNIIHMKSYLTLPYIPCDSPFSAGVTLHRLLACLWSSIFLPDYSLSRAKWSG